MKLKIYRMVMSIMLKIITFKWGISRTISGIEARLWVFCIGFILGFGGILAKLWFAHHVLTKRVFMKKRKREIIMFLIVGVLFLITIIILVTWHVVNPFSHVVEHIKEVFEYVCDITVWLDSPYTEKVTAVDQCKCGNSFIWYTLMIIWKAILIFIGVWVAYQTKNVFIPALNDTQRCGLCAFIIAGCSVVALIIGLATRLYPDVFFGIVGLIIIGCVTAVLIILFLHKVLISIKKLSFCCVPRSATEGDDDKANCFSSCSCCCATCCKGCCPKCFMCCFLCCAPFLACLSKIFSCCRKCCRNCCCGSSGARNGTNKSSEQKFIVNGVGDDKGAEIARLQRELDMKNKYIDKLKNNNKALVTAPIWTQTENLDWDGNRKKNSHFKKKPNNFKIFSQKFDYSNVKSKVDSNLSGNKTNLNRSPSGSRTNLVSVGAHSPENDREKDRLKKLLAQRDAEIQALKRRDKGNKDNHRFELQERPYKDGITSPSTVSINIDEEPKKKTSQGTAPNRIEDEPRKRSHSDVDRLLEDVDDYDRKNSVPNDANGSDSRYYAYPKKRSSVQIKNYKVDWSHVKSKLAVTGALAHDLQTRRRTQSLSDPVQAEKMLTTSKRNSITPLLESEGSASSSPEKGKTPREAGGTGESNTRKASNKSEPEQSNFSKSSDSSDTGQSSPKKSLDKIEPASTKKQDNNVPLLNLQDNLDAPNSKNDSTKRGAAPEATSYSLERHSNASNTNLNVSGQSGISPRRESNVKIFSEKKDYSHIKSRLSLAPGGDSHNDAANFNRRESNVKIFNAPINYNHVKSKLALNSPSITPSAVSPAASKKGSVQITNKPLDVSHVKSKLGI